MNIGFDLDKVLIDYPPFIPEGIIDRFYKKRAKGILLYRIPSKPEQFIRKCIHFPLFRQPITQNLNFLRTFSKKDHKLYLISSRFGFLKKLTSDLIKRHKLDTIFDEMYFNFDNEQPHLFKDEIVNKLKLHLYVDDDLSLLQYLAKRNKKIKFYWLTKHKNAQTFDEKNIFSISDLSAIVTR